MVVTWQRVALIAAVALALGPAPIWRGLQRGGDVVVVTDEDGSATTTTTPTMMWAALAEGTVPAAAGTGEAAADGLFSGAERETMNARAEKHAFEAEVSQLMKIIINSLYSQTEVFLREVISNGSDALDKIRFLSLMDPRVLTKDGGVSELAVEIRADRAARTLSVRDTGIGMTKTDLIALLGKIAQSGTATFLERFKEQQAANAPHMIGQFGVGFYSVFLVADRVTVITKSNDDPHQWVWESDSHGTYTVAEDPRGNTLGRGTQLVLHLKPDLDEYLDEKNLQDLVRKYSQFINYPIKVWSSFDVEREVPLSDDEIRQKEEERAARKAAEEAENAADADGDDDDDDGEQVIDLDGTKEDGEKKPVKAKRARRLRRAEDDEAPIPTTRTETVKEWRWLVVNDVKPLWTRPAKDITEEEYAEFYRALTKETEDPLTHMHFNAEGEVEFKSLLYVPGKAPQNMFDPTQPISKGIKLFVRRVFITDEFTDILPKYLSFIRGVIDSDDLPLNVSREMLQEHRILKLIKKKLTRKAIAMIQDLADDAEKKSKFDEFWKHYGTNIKLGVIEDTNNRTRLSKLMRFLSSKTGELTSLQEYVDRFKDGQTQIYYLAGESKAAIEASPLIENLLRKGFEVLYMTDPIDEYALSALEKFDGKHKLTNIARSGLELDGEKKDAAEEKSTSEEYADLTSFLKDTLSAQVEKVVVSKRLAQSPSALVASAWGFTANMERIVKAQALGQQQQQMLQMGNRKVMEINPRHPIVKSLLERVKAHDDLDTARDIAFLLYDTAALQSGYSLEEPKEFAKRINRMIGLSLHLESVDLPEEPVDDAAPAGDAVPEAAAATDKTEL